MVPGCVDWWIDRGIFQGLEGGGSGTGGIVIRSIIRDGCVQVSNNAIY